MTTWTFGGTALSSLGRVTIINDYLDTASRRGGNQVIPYRHGSLFVKKFFEERKITIGMAITESSATALEAKLDTIRALISPLAQQTLSMTMTDTTVRTVLASVDRPLELERVSDKIAKIVLEFSLTEPFFRSSTLYTNTTTLDTNPKTFNIVNGGTVEERTATIVLAGPLNNIVITNTTNGVALSYLSAIASGKTVTIGITSGEYTATHNTDGNVIGNVTHSGSEALMVFDVGTNAMNVATDTTGGTITTHFYTPFA